MSRSGRATRRAARPVEDPPQVDDDRALEHPKATTDREPGEKAARAHGGEHGQRPRGRKHRHRPDALPCGRRVRTSEDRVGGLRVECGNARECPEDEIAEIAVSGRSNVGKSSLPELALRAQNLVKVSSTPGKTQRLNYFLVNNRFHIVDLPATGSRRPPAPRATSGAG